MQCIIIYTIKWKLVECIVTFSRRNDQAHLPDKIHGGQLNNLLGWISARYHWLNTLLGWISARYRWLNTLLGWMDIG